MECMHFHQKTQACQGPKDPTKEFTRAHPRERAGSQRPQGSQDPMEQGRMELAFFLRLGIWPQHTHLRVSRGRLGPFLRDRPGWPPPGGSCLLSHPFPRRTFPPRVPWTDRGSAWCPFEGLGGRRLGFLHAVFGPVSTPVFLPPSTGDTSRSSQPQRSARHPSRSGNGAAGL